MEIEDAAPTRTITTKRGYTRTVTATRTTYQCRNCYQEFTVWHFPGPEPFYCDPCRQGPVHAAYAASSIRRKRQAEREAHPGDRRPVGRLQKG